MARTRTPHSTARSPGIGAKTQARRDIVVVGASAGGLQALQGLLHDLPGDFQAAVLVVLHTPPDATGYMAEILGRAGPLPAVYPLDGAEITHGCVMVAPPDHHLVVDGARVRVIRGPRENAMRPAIDPLFRTAAQSYGPRVVGVVLSGALDDGTEGMLAIHHAGGVTIVQHPEEALFPSMPLSTLRHVEVDHIASVSEIAKRLVELSENGTQEPEPASPVQDPAEEPDADLLQGTARETPAAFTCPECGGALADASHEGVVRYQCHVGHAFGAESLVAYHGEALERALWTALRTLEEAAALRHAMAARALEGGLEALERSYLRQAENLEARAEVIRTVVERETASKNDPQAQPGHQTDAGDAPRGKTAFPSGWR
jgi:two-component system chemotaxis response regulator CheB